MRPRLLDLFCGAGGCSVGYSRAGFDVTGVDIEPHADYPFDFNQGDAMAVLADREYLDQFDVVHASPPCPFYSLITTDETRSNHPDLVPPALEALRAWGGMWVVENVPGAPLPDAVMLCGAAMGLPRIKRHRLFASSAVLMSPGCACSGREVVGVYGGKRGWGRNGVRPDGSSRGRRARTHAEASEVMGIDWMTQPGDVSDAIPPNYCEFIGEQLMTQLPAERRPDGDGSADSSRERTRGISASPRHRTDSDQSTDAPAGSGSFASSLPSASAVNGQCSPASSTDRGGQD